MNSIVDYTSSALTAKDSKLIGKYKLYDANSHIGFVDNFYMEQNYITIIKDGAGVGRIRKLPINTAFIGTMGALTTKTADLNFVYYLLEQTNLSLKFSGSTIPHIYFKDYGEEIHYVPRKAEQEKIGSFFENLDHLITLHQREYEEIKHRIYDIKEMT